jgi:hypothetical protein
LRFLDHPLARDDLLTDVLAALAVRPKSIPPKYFYDEPGSRLFDANCEQPEYALTRIDGVPPARYRVRYRRRRLHYPAGRGRLRQGAQDGFAVQPFA